jgi:hypothetical protein
VKNRNVIDTNTKGTARLITEPSDSTSASERSAAHRTIGTAPYDVAR